MMLFHTVAELSLPDSFELLLWPAQLQMPNHDLPDEATKPKRIFLKIVAYFFLEFWMSLWILLGCSGCEHGHSRVQGTKLPSDERGELPNASKHLLPLQERHDWSCH